MRFESLLGRRHLFGRELRRRRTIGFFLGFILVRAAVASLVLGGGVLAFEAVQRRILGEPGMMPVGLILQSLPAVVIGYLLLIAIPRFFGLTLTTHIAILCVAIGVAALIIVLGILDGLDATFHRKYMDLVAQIEVLPPAGAREELFSDPARVEQAISRLAPVRACAPQIAREAFILPDNDIGSTRTAVQLLGLDPVTTRPVAGLVDRITEGTGEPGSGEVVLGALLAEMLGMRPGDPVWAITRVVVDAHGYPHFRMEELRVAGIFKTGIPDVDMTTAYVSLAWARHIFVLPSDAVSRYLLRIDDPYAAYTVAREISPEMAAANARVRSWDETNADFFHALRLEKVGTFVMLLMILIVAAFNIIGTLVMIVTGRTREIGILKTMGASDPMIRRLFIRSGFVIGLTGTSLGVAGGLGACYVIARTKIEIPAMLYDLTSIPIVVHVPTLLLTIVCSMAICLLASVLPAQTAARLDPVQALRHD